MPPACSRARSRRASPPAAGPPRRPRSAPWGRPPGVRSRWPRPAATGRSPGRRRSWSAGTRPGPVGGDGERPRHAQAEAPGPGLLPGKAFGHVRHPASHGYPHVRDLIPDRRLLLVHAHPDDESIGTGATMARYAADGARSRWSPAPSASWARSSRRSWPTWPPTPTTSSAATGSASSTPPVPALGVTDHRFLGGAGRWRDSGMIGTPENADSRVLLAGGRRGGRPRPGRRHPRGPPAGHGHLRRRRVLRPPRPHPGAPRRLARVPAGRRPGRRPPVWPWPVAGGPVLRQHHAALGPDRGDRRVLRAARSPLDAEVETLQATMPRTASCRPEADLVYGVPDEQVTTEIDGTRVPGRQAGRDGGPRHPDHRVRCVTSRCRTRWPSWPPASSTTRCCPRSRPLGPAEAAAPGSPCGLRRRTTCSPGLDLETAGPGRCRFDPRLRIAVAGPVPPRARAGRAG